jgi:Zinc knuckle
MGEEDEDAVALDDGGGGRGRGRNAPETLLNTPRAAVDRPASITPDDIVCWTCGKKGHRSSSCPEKQVHFTSLVEDETIFYSSHIFSAVETNVFLTAVPGRGDTRILLDTQSGIHLIRSQVLALDIHSSSSPVTIQGITGDRVRVSKEATIKDIGIKAYYSPHMSANIISYHKLRETHSVHYNEDSDTFIAVSPTGPTLTFTCVRGHYTMDIDTVLPVYFAAGPSKYSARQLSSAKQAYEFIQRMGFVSYKGAAEIIQRGSMKDIDFTRADLVNAQNIYGTPAAYQLGQGTQRTTKCREDDQIPLHESVSQELQVDIFYFLGQVFFLSISVLLGLVMVTHLGPGQDRSASGSKVEGSRSKAGKALLLHISQYKAKGFHIRTVTSDGEGAIKSTRASIEETGAQLNILGHGSHTPHAESAIRHVKNKARSRMYSLLFPLGTRFAAALIAFVVHTINMVPKHNAPGVALLRLTDAPMPELT